MATDAAADRIVLWASVIALVIASLAIAEVGRRSLRGTLPRNHLVGLRLRRTLADDESWDIAHRAGGATMIVTGLVSAALGVAVGLYGLSVDVDAAATGLLPITAILLSGVLLSARQGLRALDDARSEHPGGS